MVLRPLGSTRFPYTTLFRSGVVGLEATYEAVKKGKTVALSNKEVLVAAGELMMAAVEKAGRELLPVDSEHNAVRSEEHTSELQSLRHLVCRLLLEKKKQKNN